jgi:hypothetical protein
MLLVEEGMLGLNDPINKYLQAPPAARPAILIARRRRRCYNRLRLPRSRRRGE